MQEDYKGFLADDFLKDDLFLQWLKGTDKEIKNTWEKWYQLNPDRQSHVDEARLKYNQLISFQKKELSSIDQKAIWNTIEEQHLRSASQKISSLQLLRRIAAIFIVFAVFGAGVIYYYKNFYSVIKVLTGNGELITYQLPDSSVVTLNANSKLTYSRNFLSNVVREVWVEGEAFFNVTHKKTNQRFIVHTHDLNVEVLGTTFNVKSRRGISNVVLATGKIRLVFTDEKHQPMFMRPGDMVEYTPSENKIAKRHTASVEVVAKWREKIFVFNSTPFAKVAEELEEVYGYEIIIEDSEIARKHVSGTLNAQSDAELLSTLSTLLNAEIIKNDKQLIVKSKIHPNQ
ncbi:fec operon regulator FecR [compost metagenome]